MALPRSGDFAERLELAAHGEALERLRLDLAHPLRREAEPAAGLAQRLRIVPVDPEAQPDHVALRLRELLDRAPQELLREAHLDLLVDRRRASLEQVPECRVALVADGPVEASDRAGGVADLLDLFERELRLARDLVVRRLAPE